MEGVYIFGNRDLGWYKIGISRDIEKRFEGIQAALQLPLRAEMHVNLLKSALPEVIEKFKEAYMHEFGDNPWE